MDVTDGLRDGHRATDGPSDRPSARAMDDPPARWIGFAELADLRGISRASASKLVRRHGWRRQTDNQGHVLILVPVAALDRPQDSPVGRPQVASEGQASDRPSDGAPLDAFLTAIREAHAGETEALRERAEAAERRADAAEAAIATERQRANAVEVDRRVAEARAEQADADRRATVAAAAATAERAETAIGVERDRAERAEEALAFERVRVESLQRDVAAHLSMATEAAHGFEAVRLRAAEAERAADALRQAEAARKGRGLVARLKSAWRGD